MNKTFQLFLDAQVAQSLHTIEIAYAQSCARLGLTVDRTTLRKTEVSFFYLSRAVDARKEFIANPTKNLAQRMVFYVKGQWFSAYEIERHGAVFLHDADNINNCERLAEQVGRMAETYHFDEVELLALKLLTGSSDSLWREAGEQAQRRLASIARRANTGALPKEVRMAMFALAANLDTRTSTAPPA
jgi:hypothetical protein